MWLVLGSYKSICLAGPFKPSLAFYSPLLLRIAQPVCAYGLWQGIWPLPEEIRPSTSPLQGPHPTHTRWSSVDEWSTSLSSCCRCTDYAWWITLIIPSKVYISSNVFGLLVFIHHSPIASFHGQLCGGEGALWLICKVGRLVSKVLILQCPSKTFLHTDAIFNNFQHQSHTFMIFINSKTKVSSFIIWK